MHDNHTQRIAAVREAVQAQLAEHEIPVEAGGFGLGDRVRYHCGCTGTIERWEPECGGAWVVPIDERCKDMREGNHSLWIGMGDRNARDRSQFMLLEQGARNPEQSAMARRLAADLEHLAEHETAEADWPGGPNCPDEYLTGTGSGELRHMRRHTERIAHLLGLAQGGE